MKSLTLICALIVPVILSAQTFEPSDGVYRIPYATGTDVYVTNDHQQHSPVGRIDMSGVNGNSYTIVAAEDGWIRYIVDDNTDSQGSCINNNYIWLEHPNGEWTKYSHIETNSATGAGLTVGMWVTQGTYLGIESDIGCASGPHLHFEVSVPDDPSNPINPAGGYIIGENRMPIICDIPGNVFDSGETYTANPCGYGCPGGVIIAGANVGAQDYLVSMADQAISTFNGNSIIFQDESTGALRAGERITLRPGFEARSGCSFYAKLRDCNQSQ